MLHTRLAIVLALFTVAGFAQPVQLNNTIITAKQTEQQRLRKMIDGCYALPLDAENELAWESAFWAMELLRYKPKNIPSKITEAFRYLPAAGYSFQRAFMEWLYTFYLGKYNSEVYHLAVSTKEPRIFALCCTYLAFDVKKYTEPILQNMLIKKYSQPVIKATPVLHYLHERYNSVKPKKLLPEVLMNSDFLKGHAVLFSIQPAGRKSPGRLFIRRANGSFVEGNGTGKRFSLPQLARSLSNLPFYVSMGNTPQGIFLFTGFDVSKSHAIGPTENLQLQMPFETTPAKFLRDSSITDTAWTINLYNRLIPAAYRQADISTHPLYETYIASAAGRDEIIAHGTTVNPEYYRNTPWYPFTPTVGCLCTKEMWNYKTGQRTYSDQQILVDVLKREGIKEGYLVVLE